jgi:hypothetical protein
MGDECTDVRKVKGGDRLESVCFEGWRNLGRMDHDSAPD